MKISFSNPGQQLLLRRFNVHAEVVPGSKLLQNWYKRRGFALVSNFDQKSNLFNDELTFIMVPFDVADDVGTVVLY